MRLLSWAKKPKDPGSWQWSDCWGKSGAEFEGVQLSQIYILQTIRLSDYRQWMYVPVSCSEIKPLPPERAGLELQPSRRIRSGDAFRCTGWSALETGNSQVEWDIRHHRYTQFMCAYVSVFISFCYSQFFTSLTGLITVEHVGWNRHHFGVSIKKWLCTRTIFH